MILVRAFLANNFGDDVFMRMLVRRYPSETFYFNCTKEYIKAISREPNIKYNNRVKSLINRCLDKMHLGSDDLFCGYIRNQRYKAIVHIGGSIFIEKEGWKAETIREKNAFFIGANFGPYRTAEYLNYIKSVLKDASDCCFRDNYSKELFDELDNVRCQPDIAFGYSELPAYNVGSAVGISVINLKNRNDMESVSDLYEDGIVEICNYHIKHNKKVKLFEFCAFEKDIEAIERILKRINDKRMIEVVRYDSDLDGFISQLNTCSILYSTRFHGMIFGWLLEKMVVPIIYSKKQTNIITDLSFKGSYWDVLSRKSMPSECLNPGRDNTLPRQVLKELAEAANLQFYGLDVFLYGKSK